MNWVGSIFRQGEAEGNSGNGTPVNSDQLITVLATSKGKNSEGAVPAADGDGSTVIIESGEFNLPSGASMRGAISKDAPASLQQFRNFSIAASKVAKIKGILENSDDTGTTTTGNTTNNSSENRVIDVTGVPYRQKVGIDTLNGVERTMTVRKNGETVQLKRPIR